MELVSLEVFPIAIPLLEPFVIATGTMVTTRSVLLSARVRADGREGVGLGEAAALPPVTDCDLPDLLEWGAQASRTLIGLTAANAQELDRELAARILSPVLRAGVEAAILDGWAKAKGQAVFELLAHEDSAARDRDRNRRDAATGDGALLPFVVETDITIPIGEPVHMADLATAYRERGFCAFKVKVGRNVDDDVRALRRIAARVPDARFRIDANGGYSLEGARRLLDALQGLTVECFEQPCPRGDEAAAIALTRDSSVPTVADESMRNEGDLARIIETKSARGVNLKLVKHGGLWRAVQLGRAARQAGLSLMCGAMVETRVGLSAMLHVMAAIARSENSRTNVVDWVDLDTQLLLNGECASGGYDAEGPRMTMLSGQGFSLERAPS